MNIMLINLKEDLRKFVDPGKKEVLQRFFKTGPGQYAEGDVFLGVTVPQSRLVAIKYKDLVIDDLGGLLKSAIHEERLVALLILVNRFMKGDAKIRKDVYSYYLENTRYVNNWDLVDTSADKIAGAFLWENPKERPVLLKLAGSKSIWERRIAIIATFYFIRKNEFKTTLQVAELLLEDEHDLIHKAVGWMLRELGKRDKKTEVDFLRIHRHNMPRVMLRYAIEKFSPAERSELLSKKNV